jgi:hypothetical protein
MCIAYLLDRNKKGDFSFWGYFFGALTFWISLSGLSWDEGEFVFLCIW